MIDEVFYTFGEYMKFNELTISEEDYLEMVYRLCLKDNYTRVSELAQKLNVKAPSASKMIKKLVNKNLVKHIEYGIIQLTKTGEEVGKMLFQRHQIVEDFLKILNIKEELLEETEKIEHTISPNTISKLKKTVEFFKDNPDVLLRFNEWIK